MTAALALRLLLQLPGLPAASSRLEDTVALGAFLDGVMSAHLEQFHIPSAVITVVQGTRVLYAKGFGHANLAQGTRVDPATSLFHIGSTGKLFTWTAVMQLVERGRLDLDADVNIYLKTFKIPNTFPTPITLRHLMTHTAGFQEGIVGYFIGNDSVHIRSIEETLRHHIPRRVRPPGEFASYSNYGASLAGLIVEQVSGEPFAEYIKHHIYDPLGIRYATFREPLPASLKPHAVIGYAREEGLLVPQPFEIDGGFVPSGGTVMSAMDMGRFMMAHLQDGQYGGGRILEATTAQLMHRRAFSHDSRLPGMCLGFIEQEINGHRVIGHDGDSEYFHVEMLLIPDQQVGLFVGYGGDGGKPAREGLKRTFFNRYFPAASAPLPAPPADFANTAERYAGKYRFIRMNYTDIDKVIFLAALPPITVSVLPNHHLLVSGGLRPDWTPAQFTPVGKHLFQEIGGPTQLAFREDDAGRITRLFVDPTVGTERVPWYEQSSFWYPLLSFATVIFLTVWIGYFYRRSEFRTLDARERWGLRLSLATTGWLFATVVVIGLVVGVYQMSLLERIPFALRAALVMPLVFVGLSAALTAEMVGMWRRRQWTLGRRLHFTLVTLSAAAFCWFFYQWNILGWRFG